VKQIAGALDLPTTASDNDLLVMVCGRLHDNQCDPFNVQVVALLLETRDMLLYGQLQEVCYIL